MQRAFADLRLKFVIVRDKNPSHDEEHSKTVAVWEKFFIAADGAIGTSRV